MKANEFFTALKTLKKRGWTAYTDSKRRIRLKPPHNQGIACCPIAAVYQLRKSRGCRSQDVRRAAKQLGLDSMFWSYIVHAADSLLLQRTEPDQKITEVRVRIM